MRTLLVSLMAGAGIAAAAPTLAATIEVRFDRERQFAGEAAKPPPLAMAAE